jgi:hypothetical protein
MSSAKLRFICVSLINGIGKSVLDSWGSSHEALSLVKIELKVAEVDPFLGGWVMQLELRLSLANRINKYAGLK